MNDKKQVKDLIEKTPNWEYTYLYEGSRTCGKSYIQHLLNEKDKEIERLNNELQDFKVQDISNQEQLYNLIEENERLNNIINELEKWLNHSIESINEKLNNARDKSGIIYSMNDYQILRLRTFRIKMKEVLEKLQELKGSDKE